jgi:AcrR family transcriptional regulator
MQAGRTPSVAEVADLALVSRATAYRYFPSQSVLLVKAMLVDQALEALERRLGDDLGGGDAPSRLDLLVETFLRFPGHNDAWRKIMAVAVQQGPATTVDGETTINATRGEARISFIRRALEPVDTDIAPESRPRLEAALALCVGTEAFLALRDLCGLDEDDAVDAATWAAKALLEVALRESAAARDAASPATSA